MIIVTTGNVSLPCSPPVCFFTEASVSWNIGSRFFPVLDKYDYRVLEIMIVISGSGWLVFLKMVGRFWAEVLSSEAYTHHSCVLWPRFPVPSVLTFTLLFRNRSFNASRIPLNRDRNYACIHTCWKYVDISS